MRWFTVAFVITTFALPMGATHTPLGAQSAVVKSPLQ